MGWNLFVGQAEDVGSIPITCSSKFRKHLHNIKDMSKYNPLFVEEEFKKFIAD